MSNGKDNETEIAIQGSTSDFWRQMRLNCEAERHHYSMFNVGCSMFAFVWCSICRGMGISRHLFYFFLTWVVPSSSCNELSRVGFNVQRLQPMDTAHNFNQIPAYPSYLIKLNGSTTRWRHDHFDMSCLCFFNPERWTMNPSTYILIPRPKISKASSRVCLR